MGIFWIGLYLSLALLLLLSANYCEYDLISYRNRTTRTRTSVKIDIKDLLVVTLIVIFAVFCATRDMNSYDTQVYYNWYTKIISSNFWTLDGEYLPAFEIITKIISLLVGNNFRMYLFILAFINLLTVYRATKKTNNVGLYGFIVYLFFIGFYYNFCVLRQGLAFSFIFIGVEQWKKSKIRSFVFFVMAALSHESAWIMLIVVLITKIIKLSKSACYGITIVSLINYIFSFSEKIFKMVIPVFYRYIPARYQGKFALYFMHANEDGSISLFYIMYFLITLFLIYRLYYDNNNEVDYQNMSINRVLCANTIGLLILSFGSIYSIISRVADYLILSSFVILLPIALKRYKKSTRDIVIIILCLLAFIIQMRIFIGVIEIRIF